MAYDIRRPGPTSISRLTAEQKTFVTEASATHETTLAGTSTQVERRVQIAVRVTPEMRRRLTRLVAKMELDTGEKVTEQSLITGALEDLLTRHKA